MDDTHWLHVVLTAPHPSTEIGGALCSCPPPLSALPSAPHPHPLPFWARGALGSIRPEICTEKEIAPYSWVKAPFCSAPGGVPCCTAGTGLLGHFR